MLFPPFRLDPLEGRLWRDSARIPLRPKSFSVLRYLLEHPGRLITKQELIQAAWPGTYVTEAALKVCVREIRQALGDDRNQPRFIETELGRGYRFIGKIGRKATGAPGSLVPTVGRKTELARLAAWLRKALSGQRQIVWIAGEPGVGKTTVLEAFLEQIRSKAELWIGRGQCIEHYGGGEAYMPLLEALGRGCREPGGDALLEGLRRFAPMWLMQLPSLVTEAEMDALLRRTQGATRDRMLREMAEAAEALTAERAVVLALEDVHWSDQSTLDLLSYLARRKDDARLMVIITYRMGESSPGQRRLVELTQELCAHGQCEGLQLAVLTAAEVGEYVSARFPRNRFPADFVKWVHSQTGGNPLFIVNVLDYLATQRILLKVDGAWALAAGVRELSLGVPDSLRPMIQKQVDPLAPELRVVLEASSVAGVDFCAAAVAGGLERAIGDIEAICDELAHRGQFLRSLGSTRWPDGTVSGRYGFSHALYQSLLYEGVPESRRAEWHQRIGERQERGYGDLVGGVAAELAVHFERGGYYVRAAEYLRRAGESAVQRHAYREAIDYITRALSLTRVLPNTPQRARQELMLQVALGVPLIATRGYADSQVREAYARARELMGPVPGSPALFPVLWGLCAFHLVRADLAVAEELGGRLADLANAAEDASLRVQAYEALVAPRFWRGELTSALAYAEEERRLYTPARDRSLASRYGHDCGVNCRCYLAWIQWLLGYPDQALSSSRDALELARELSHPYSLAVALDFASMFHQFRRDARAVIELADAAIALSTEHGFPVWMAFGRILRGWALAERGQSEEGIRQMREGLSAFSATGAELTRPYFLTLLAEAQGKVGRTEEARELIAEALSVAERGGERFYEAEIHRLEGELLTREAKTVGRGSVDEAETCFRRAIDVARRQEASSLELRAAVSLGRLWQSQRKGRAARDMLDGVYGWFSEGFDTSDLKAGRALLDELRAPQ